MGVNEGRSLSDSSANRIDQTEFYKVLVNSIQDYAIFLLDPHGTITSWNIGAEKLKGYKPNEIIGKHFSTFYSKADRESGKPEASLEETQKEGHIEDESWRYRKDGSRFWANIVITALYDTGGSLIGYVKVTRDLTARKRYEDELEDVNRSLRKQHAELEALNSAKDEFVSLASHQLRTPATGVKQFLGLLMEGYAGELNEKQSRYLRRAYESNERQIELVNSLLRVAQVDAGQVILSCSDTDIVAMVKDVITEQRDSIDSRNQNLSIYLPGSPIVMYVDKPRLRMVVENLIDNASKYTPENGEITIKVDQTDTDVVVSVSDTGVGVDLEELPKLFMKFSRIPNMLSESVGGSGLGLYWADKIVTLHGGNIAVKSEKGEGSEFAVSIPKMMENTKKDD